MYVNRHIRKWFLAAFIFTGAVAGSSGAESSAILANPGFFSNVQVAAAAEEQVNWQDADPQDDRACTECFAATELASFLPACTSLTAKDIRFGPPDQLPPEGDVILLGSRQSNSLIAALDLPESRSLKTPQSFYLKAWRQDDRIITVIEGADRQGTLYGTYAYLEQLGMRFFGLGDKRNSRAGQTIKIPVPIYQQGQEANYDLVEDYTIPDYGTVYPDQARSLPDALSIISEPSYLTRGFWVFEPRGNTEFYLWMARNRMNYWTALEKNVHYLKKLGFELSQGWHIIQDRFLSPHAEYPYHHALFPGKTQKPADPYAVSPDYRGDIDGDGKLSYFEAHPEWYALRDGKRSDNIGPENGDNFCTSNADARNELAKNLVQSLIDGEFRYADVVDFWMLDVGKWCQCDNCRQQGSCTDRLIEVVDTVLKKIALARSEDRLPRRIKLSSLAYLETIAPPQHPLPLDFDYDNFAMTYYPIERCYAHALADPACSEINRHLMNKYLGWTHGENRTYQGDIFIGEYYNVSSIKTLPVLLTKIIAEDIPWYYRNGARYFHFMHAPTRSWGTWTLNMYLLARMLWDVNADANALQEDFFSHYYPTTSVQTRLFYDTLEQAMSNIKAWKHMVGTRPEGISPGNLDSLYQLPERLANEHSDLFPLDHLHYEAHHPAQNDAVDIEETSQYLTKAREHVNAALTACNNLDELARLKEDERRFAYGEALFGFYYHLIRTARAHRQNDTDTAKTEFEQVDLYARQLETITDLVHVASSHANAENGLKATLAIKAYTFYKKTYGR